jgi:hypothetical protein
MQLLNTTTTLLLIQLQVIHQVILIIGQSQVVWLTRIHHCFKMQRASNYISNLRRMQDPLFNQLLNIFLLKDIG